MNLLLELLTNEANRNMQYELLLILACLAASGLRARDQRQLFLSWGGMSFVLLYLHRILLPFLLSGAYVFLLLGLLSALYEWDLSAFRKPFRKLRSTLLELTSFE